MSNIQIFENPEFGSVRTTGNDGDKTVAANAQTPQVFVFDDKNVRVVIVDGEPWWVLKDVCDVLGIAEPHRVASRLDEDEKADRHMMTVSSNGTKQSREMTTVNESGLYNVILRSDKPEAKKFRKWVTSEVLPSIRKTGSYAVQKTPHELVLESMRYLLSEVERERSLRIAAETKIEEDRPSTELGNALRYHNAIAKACQIAYALFNNGVNIGRNRLIAHLRQQGIINKSDALLSQKALENGIGENVPTGKYEYHDNTILSYTAFFNYKGIQMIFDDFSVSPAQREAVLKDLTDDGNIL